ncbi:sensor histidine kinase [Paenibacillus sp. y28]|uniref:sensor histidine kinase n=1 Tax=Paenibacillus sp. y28 TaxID=3129110 RepID=UPI00301A7012
MKNNRSPSGLFAVPASFVRDVLDFMRNQIGANIRLQLILTFVLCFFTASVVGVFSSPFFMNLSRQPVIEYMDSIAEIDSMALSILNELNNGESAHEAPQEPVLSEDQRIRYSLEAYRSQSSSIKILILDLDGKVMYKSDNATESQVDLHTVIREGRSLNTPGTSPEGKEYSSFYPITLQDGKKAYLVVSGIPKPQISYQYSNSPYPYVLGLIVFIILFYSLTKKKMAYIQHLAGGLMEISRGNLNYRAREVGRDELGVLATNINHMAEQLQFQLEEERRAEKMKNELITGVSHDLRTPLTLIMGYLRLLKDKNYESPGQADSYINIAYGKAEKLKVLIDDLFEYTKLSSGGVSMLRERVCLNELLEQLTEELITYAEENQLSVKRSMTMEKLMVEVEPDQMTRVFENLLSNAIKYSYKPGLVKLLLYRDGAEAKVCITNRGSAMTNEQLDRLFDRFYRIDPARSSETGGSGLGLAIAKSIIESHDGSIWAESDGEEIRFWVSLKIAS